LFDPPRKGLSQDVRVMVVEGNFKNLLCIWCGQDALVRNFDRLVNHFQVVDRALLDLFAGTTSVKLLVHLERIQR
jgi:tRNA/tmRNA/rRNA uracil-C5-methylase (TrmA/RlmC/RlmD family)